MLKLLSKLFGRDLTTPSEPITRIPDEEIINELLASNSSPIWKKKELKKFLLLITSHLKKAESQRLIKQTLELLDDADSTFDALSDSMLDELGGATIRTSSRNSGVNCGTIPCTQPFRKYISVSWSGKLRY
jgi:hypothetical protein